MPPVSLTGLPICITGASAGIGRAAAVQCARAGMPVVVAARRLDRLDSLVSEIRLAGGRAVAFAADVNDAAACRAMVEACIAEFGSVYSVFANAGYGVEQPIHEMSEADLRAIFETNFFGTMNAIRPALPHMLERRAGHILICSSCVARFPLPFYGAYSATKAAQHHIGRAMGLELEPRGVRVSTVHPVGTKTEFFTEIKRRNAGAPLVIHAPEFLMQSPDTVARAVVRCLRRPKSEVWTSRFTRISMAVGAAFPRLADLGVRGHVRQKMRAVDGQR